MSETTAPRYFPWTPESEALFRQLYPLPDWSTPRIIQALAAQFGMEPGRGSIQWKAREMGLRKTKARQAPKAKWSPEMEAMVIDLFKAGAEDAAIAQAVSERHGAAVTTVAVYAKRKTLGLFRVRCGRWPESAVDLLKEHYGGMPSRDLAAMIKSRTGHPATEDAVTSKAFSMGLDERTAQGLITKAQLAEELGVVFGRLDNYIRRHGLATHGTGRVRFLPDETVAELRKAFPTLREPVMKTREAARALAFTQDTIENWCKSRKLPGVRFGGEWMIPVSAVEAKRRALGITRPLPQTFGTSKRTAS